MSLRIQRVNELIKRELSRIIFREVEFPSGILVTLTRTAVSSDLNQIRVYISVIPQGQAQEILERLNKLIYFLQQKLNKRLKMRPIPKIKFEEEKETERAARVEELLEEINQNSKSEIRNPKSEKSPLDRTKFGTPHRVASQ